MAWTGAGIRPPPGIPLVAASLTSTNVVNEAPFDPNDTASPFFLHSSENPSLILVSAVLDGRNYHPWSSAMEMALLSKNKLGFVDGTIEVPSVADVKFPYWKRCNNMVSTWITRSVSPEIAQTILWLGTAARIWNTLKARFSVADIFRVFDLQAEIHQIRQGDLSVSGYLAKLNVLWDELQVIRPLPTCKCANKCNCGLLDTLQKHMDCDNLSVFLRGLNESYSSVQSQIMMMKPLPTVDEAFMMVQQQETRLNGGIIGLQSPHSTEGLGAGSVFLAQTSGNNSGSKKFYSNGNKKPVCTFCGFTRHTVEKCYKKHGYPPGWKPRTKSGGAINQMQLNTT
ncbi:PREDICTED: uncharacterized protein LOC109155052 [Ipomoea nil]|uniref:uncharacterized protein LOC109155052 n=1 Tax=Ipomoea nil TaxID=35883 RepID=UPI000900F1C5|nr:PREDICTED: uncharacterized protein LOC109155052 [Ipomoea nil]